MDDWNLFALKATIENLETTLAGLAEMRRTPVEGRSATGEARDLQFESLVQTDVVILKTLDAMWRALEDVRITVAGLDAKVDGA